MKKLFCFLTTSLLLFSCSNDDQVSSNNLDQKSQNSIQKIKTEFNEEYKLIPNYEKFKNVDWDNPKVFTYGDNKKGISLKTYNTKNENEFNLLIGYNKEGEEYYFLSTDKPQELTTEDIVMLDNGKTVVYTQEIYGNKSNNKDLNSKKSVRSTDTGLISGNDPREELPGIYIYTRPGLSDYYNPGRTGNYLDYDSMKELDNWNRGGGGGSTAVTSPAPEDKIIIDKTFEDNECVKAIYDKLGGTNFAKKYIKIFDKNLNSPNLTFKIVSEKEYSNFKRYDDKENYLGISFAETIKTSQNNYTIYLNGDSLDKITELQIATTLIHEVLHATFHRQYDSVIDTSNGTNWKPGGSTKSFPALFNALYKDGLGGHHELMATSYISTMTNALKELDPQGTYSSYYKALAWEGLANSNIKAFQNLSTKEKDEIKSYQQKYKSLNNTIECK